MALKKLITQDTGVVAEYHNIQDISYTPKVSIQIRVQSYLNEEARRSGKSPVGSSRIGIALSRRDRIEEEVVVVDLEKDVPAGNEMERAYHRLKAQDGWAGSEDI